MGPKDWPDPKTLESTDGAASLEATFRSVYEARFPAIFRYVLRRLWVTARSDVPDVTAEIFTVAWRRHSEIPEPPEDLLWLYGIARRVVSRHLRAIRRREKLWDRLVAAGSHPPITFESQADEREVLRIAIEQLRPHEREAVRLVMWEQLTHAQAARVLSCSENAVALRIFRARNRLGALLSPDSMGPDR